MLEDSLMMSQRRRSRYHSVHRRRLRRGFNILLLMLGSKTMIRLTVCRPRRCSHHIRMVQRRRRRKSTQPLIVHVLAERQAVRGLSSYHRRIRISGLHSDAGLLVLVWMLLMMRRCRRLVYVLVLRHGSKHLVTKTTGNTRRRRRQSVDVQSVGGGRRHLSTSGRRTYVSV